MTSTSKNPNKVYWIITIIALFWNLMGVAQFFMQAMNTESFRAQYSAEDLVIIDNLPLYYILIFAVAVFASFLGVVFLIARRKQAIAFFTVGLIAVLLQSAYNLFINDGKSAYGPVQYAMLIMIPAIAAILWYYANLANRRGWLR
jgi:hypothetical protein